MQETIMDNEIKNALDGVINQPLSPAQKVPLSKKVAWGFGGLADNYIMNSLLMLALPIYNIALGMDPIKLGIALFIPRLLDALTDPLMGHISDNTVSRWGRRKPYIIIGITLCALILPLLWTSPFKSQSGMFWYFMFMAIVYLSVYTVFVVPYTALGYELTSDYDEKTRTLAWRMYIGLAGSLSVPWLYKLCLLPIFGGDAVKGAFWVSVGTAFIILGSGLAPAFFCKEQYYERTQKIGILKSIFWTLHNKPFAILIITYIIIIGGLFSSGVLGLYINIYHVCGGDKSFAATLSGLTGSIMGITSYASLPLITYISVRTGKREAMIMGLILAIIGYGSLWFTLTPKFPYLQLVSAFVIGLGLQGCWLMISSMVGDICDEDELKTGMRREGVYSAVTGFAMKIALSLTSLLGGILLKISGYESKIAEATGTVEPNVMLMLRVLFIAVQCLALAIAIVMFLFYPISRARAHQTRMLLENRKNNFNINIDN
ncbi:MAG: hypothetical protein A2Y10_16430 [Planctomycetes bacterium GWF2_41_51]|nr:MAG: hypothetical protein A2Y10_16430 [Planctomycetes bacterium GWF2_41_51]HBG27907.1 hypothetical protein [Phycisphaerales bacterium]